MRQRYRPVDPEGAYAHGPMTSVATLVDRLRRAAAGTDPVRDAAVVLSEFIDEGGLEPVDDPFHPARRAAVTGPVASLSGDPTIVLIRSSPAVDPVPQCHGVPVAIALLGGRLAIDVYGVESDAVGDDDQTRELGEADQTSELGPGDVYVLDDDVVHRLRFTGDQPGLAIHVALGDLGQAIRTIWVNGDPTRVEGSHRYPLTNPDG